MAKKAKTPVTAAEVVVEDVIQKGVEIPAQSRAGRNIKLLQKMEPGDSVVVTTSRLQGIYKAAKGLGIKVTSRAAETAGKRCVWVRSRVG